MSHRDRCQAICPMRYVSETQQCKSSEEVSHTCLCQVIRYCHTLGWICIIILCIMKYRKHVSTIECTVKVPLYTGVEVLDMYMWTLSVLVDVSPKLSTLNSIGGVKFSEERSRYRNAQKRGVGDG